MRNNTPCKCVWVLLCFIEGRCGICTCEFAGIKFTRNFIEFVLVETNQCLVVIQTWSWRGKPAAIARAGLQNSWSKCRALAFVFSVRLCYMFLILKGRWKSDLGLCITLVLAKRRPLHSADFRRILRPNKFLNQKSALRSGILFASTKLMHKPRFDSPQATFFNTFGH